MRILAGEMKGREILMPKQAGVRPVSGRIRQSLFDILAPRIAGTAFLDLFAGSGAVGLEALSRGARFACFVEANPGCVELIRANLETLGCADRAVVAAGNVLGDLAWVSHRSGVGSYDLVFLGPPYKDRERRALAYSTPALARVAASGLAAPGCWIVLQHHLKETPAPPAGWEIFRREKYGDTYLSFLGTAA